MEVKAGKSRYFSFVNLYFPSFFLFNLSYNQNLFSNVKYRLPGKFSFKLKSKFKKNKVGNQVVQ